MKAVVVTAFGEDGKGWSLPHHATFVRRRHLHRNGENNTPAVTNMQRGKGNWNPSTSPLVCFSRMPACRGSTGFRVITASSFLSQTLCLLAQQKPAYWKKLCWGWKEATSWVRDGRNLPFFKVLLRHLNLFFTPIQSFPSHVSLWMGHSAILTRTQNS